MGPFQKLITLVLFLAAVEANATWQVSLSRAGFFGSWAIGGIYEWSDRHSVELAAGQYQIQNKNYWQSDLAYRYAIWKTEYENIVWAPIQPGLFAIGSWDRENYFLKSPSKYPYDSYYDQTAVRWGLEFSSVVGWKNAPISIAYHIRIIDAGVVAIYNNSHKELQYYLSSGISLRYAF